MTEHYVDCLLPLRWRLVLDAVEQIRQRLTRDLQHELAEQTFLVISLETDSLWEMWGVDSRTLLPPRACRCDGRDLEPVRATVNFVFDSWSQTIVNYVAHQEFGREVLDTCRAVCRVDLRVRAHFKWSVEEAVLHARVDPLGCVCFKVWKLTGPHHHQQRRTTRAPVIATDTRLWQPILTHRKVTPLIRAVQHTLAATASRTGDARRCRWQIDESIYTDEHTGELRDDSQTDGRLPLAAAVARCTIWYSELLRAAVGTRLHATVDPHRQRASCPTTRAASMLQDLRSHRLLERSTATAATYLTDIARPPYVLHALRSPSEHVALVHISVDRAISDQMYDTECETWVRVTRYLAIQTYVDDDPATPPSQATGRQMSLRVRGGHLDREAARQRYASFEQVNRTMRETAKRARATRTAAELAVAMHLLPTDALVAAGYELDLVLGTLKNAGACVDAALLRLADHPRPSTDGSAPRSGLGVGRSYERETGLGR